MLTESHQSALTFERQAPFIAFVGVMGVGKSTLTQALAQRLGAKSLIEPGAEAWPIAGDKWEEHAFILEQWVRNINLAHFNEALDLTENGTAVVADGGLFLLTKECIDNPSCQFYFGLFSDKEKQETRQVAQMDWNEAPCPNILVLLETDIDTWKRFLSLRGRAMDGNEEFIANYTGQQKVIREAAQKYAAEKGIKLISFMNIFSKNIENADRLYLEIKNSLHEPTVNHQAVPHKINTPGNAPH